MISLKPGVVVTGIRPELLLGVIVAERVYERNHYPLTITSLSDGEHRPNSLHYKGFAADLRTRDVAMPLLGVITRELKEALGRDYDVVLEGDHLHLEFDKKDTK